MGLALGMSNSESYKINDKNPNPHVFGVVDRTDKGDFSLLEVVYPNCTNYEGRKIILFKGLDLLKSQINNRNLDPHFIEGEDGVLARFRPDELGKHLARIMLNELFMASVKEQRNKDLRKKKLSDNNYSAGLA